MRIPLSLSYEYLYRNRYLFIVLLITACGTALRLFGLTVHCLWLDELQSVVTCNPANSFGGIREICVRSYDPAPPTFYYLLNIWFRLFGYSDLSARLFPSIFGIASIPLMYVLGKTVFNHRTGIFAALFTAVNYYNIFYSLEVRFYSLLFFFSALSYLCFFKLLIKENKKSAIYYALSTIMLIALHYFALLIFITQLLSWLITKRGDIRRAGQHFYAIGAFLLVIAGFFPFIPHLLRALSWDEAGQAFDGDHFFMIYYFNLYFGLNGIVVLSALVCITVYLLLALQKRLPFESGLAHYTSFLILMWVLLPLFIAYTRTLSGSSALAQRYAVVILPGLMLMVAMGAECVKDRLLKAGLIALFVGGSFLKLLFISNFYGGNDKDDFRGIVQKINSSTRRAAFSVYSDRNWHLRYYFNQFGMQPQLIDVAEICDARFVTGNMRTIDALKRDSSLKDLWVASAHFSGLQKMKNVSYLVQASGSFLKIDSFAGKDAFADHFVRKDWQLGVAMYERLNGITLIPGKMQVPGKHLIHENNTEVMVIWGGMIQSQKVFLGRGDYKLQINCRGTAAKDTFPELEVKIDNHIVGQCASTRDYQDKVLNFRIESDTSVTVYLRIVNDLYDPASNEDRNVFIRKMVIK